jgi:hypothetical protein
MLNEHTRDALMVSALDASGKAAMKGLWREYEKQRYTGEGLISCEMTACSRISVYIHLRLTVGLYPIVVVQIYFMGAYMSLYELFPAFPHRSHKASCPFLLGEAADDS